MSLLDPEIVVVAARHGSAIFWFRCDRELWMLDRAKWRDDFVKAGFAVPEEDPSNRFGIAVVNEQTQTEFLAKMEPFQVERSQLAGELIARFDDAKSWWDVGDLFPIMLVDFDRKAVAAFYPGGTPMERYVVDGWSGDFEDFATTCSEDIFPRAEKFWIREELDMLAVLNERGAKLAANRNL